MKSWTYNIINYITSNLPLNISDLSNFQRECSLFKPKQSFIKDKGKLCDTYRLILNIFLVSRKQAELSDLQKNQSVRRDKAKTIVY